MTQRGWSIAVPHAKENEPNCTAKQLDFIRELFVQIGKDNPFEYVEDGELGKWQASVLINQLLELRDNGPVKH